MDNTEKPKLSLFVRFSNATSKMAGKPFTFMIALLVVIVWGTTGPMFKFSDTWQLVINTGTTIVTFLMVFLIQNTQNRDAVAVQLKLDELIIAVKAARNEMVNVEDLDEKELAAKRQEIVEFADEAKQKVREITGELKDKSEKDS
ncbi:MAG: low affinity iron permease family protein [Pyrinomonadaceae bacterium]